MVWQFIGVLHGCLEIQHFSSHVEEIFHSFTNNYLSTLEEKFPISARQFSILYLCCTDPSAIYTIVAKFYTIHVHYSIICIIHIIMHCLPSQLLYYKLTGTYMYSVIWILNHCSKLSVKEQWKHYEPALLFQLSGRQKKCKKDQFGTM